MDSLLANVLQKIPAKLARPALAHLAPLALAPLALARISRIDTFPAKLAHLAPLSRLARRAPPQRSSRIWRSRISRTTHFLRVYLLREFSRLDFFLELSLDG